jgi:opacity protein-like surface antigen
MKTIAFCCILAFAFSTLAHAGSDKQVADENAAVTPPPFRFMGELTVEQAYIGDSDVARGPSDVNDFDELYSHLRVVYTPRVKFGIIRAGVEFERYSFGFSNGGAQLPNTLQAVNAVIGLDTEFSDSILVRLEAQPGFYGTTFGHFDAAQFNVPFIIGGTYIYSPSLQFVLGIGVNVQQKYPVLPGGGLRWKFARDWVLDAVLPTPRLEYSVTHDATVFLGADIKTNTFRVDDHFGDSHGDPALNGAWLSYEELRIGLGVEWKLTSTLSLSLEGGYLPYRDFDYHRTDVRYHNESGGPYASLQLQGSF